jgi:hypothetical protein
MPSIQKETSVGAGTTNPNLFSGSAFEYPERNSIVSLGVTAAATGTFVTVQAGGEVVLEESAPIVKTTMPVIPDDFAYNFAIAAGRRLIVAARNPTGGAVIHRAIAQITYL